VYKRVLSILPQHCIRLKLIAPLIDDTPKISLSSSCSEMTSTGKRKRLVAMFCMTFSFMLTELIVGYCGDSMALVADSFHMMSDVVALAVAFISILVLTEFLNLLESRGKHINIIYCNQIFF
jgi:zinc transporter 1